MQFAFCSPGKQNFVVNYISENDVKNQFQSNDNEANNTIQKPSIYVDKILAPIREEAVAQKPRKVKYIVKKREFIKDSSVFSGWKGDNPIIIAACFKFDKNFWKLHKIIKEEEELNQVETQLLNLYDKLKEIFNFYASLSDFPTINFRDFRKLADKAHFID